MPPILSTSRTLERKAAEDLILSSSWRKFFRSWELYITFFHKKCMSNMLNLLLFPSDDLSIRLQGTFYDLLWLVLVLNAFCTSQECLLLIILVGLKWSLQRDKLLYNPKIPIKYGMIIRFKKENAINIVLKATLLGLNTCVWAMSCSVFEIKKIRVFGPKWSININVGFQELETST